ncbi:helix-turn-helix domain-containing protein [Embleya sp. NPDC020886]|uniref:helix-turn-helix domain-containing protein n=1 Tax=Embleya sp. NPDC020886 TaxID=3363980 RepID=UPI0037A0EA5A
MVDDHDLSIGQRVKALRKERGIDRRAMATALDRSPDWMRSVEDGRRQLDRFSTILTIADLLGVSLLDLVGTPHREARRDEAPRGLDAVPTLRRALLRHQLGQPTGAPRNLADIHLDTLTAHRYRANARFGELGLLLPALIDDASTAAAGLAGDERLAAAGFLSSCLADAAMMAKKLGAIDLATIAARQAADAAIDAESPLLSLAAAWTQAEVCMSAGATSEADATIRTALDRLDGMLGDDMAVWSLWGTLHLVAAVGAAQWCERRDAEQHLAEARRAAERTGERNDFETAFGPANVALLGVSARLELGDGRASLEATRGVDLARLPKERKARRYIDIGRAHAQDSDDEASMRALLEADRIAPEYVHAHPLVRDMVTTAKRRNLLASREPVLRMARRIGI